MKALPQVPRISRDKSVIIRVLSLSKTPWQKKIKQDAFEIHWFEKHLAYVVDELN